MLKKNTPTENTNTANTNSNSVELTTNQLKKFLQEHSTKHSKKLYNQVWGLGGGWHGAHYSKESIVSCLVQENTLCK